VALFVIAVMAFASPLFADEYTKLLIRSDDADGSTTFVDSSASGHIITANGAVHHETDAQKSGATSMFFDWDTKQDFLTVPANADFDFSASDFTIDCWTRFDYAPQQAQTIFGGNSDYKFGLMFNLAGVNKMALWLSSTGSGWTIANFAQGIKTDWVSNQWYHTALVWDGTNYKVYVDGTLDITVPSSVGLCDTTGIFIGQWGYTGHFLDGYIDEFRVSKGIARWTENFTPYDSPQLFDDISFGLTNLTLEYDDTQKNQLYNLYDVADMEASLDLGDGITWSYSDNSDPVWIGHIAGDSWTVGGIHYIMLGSGIIGEPLGGAVPELPAGMMPFIGVILSFGLRRLKCSHK
ncbi:MAG: LamG domain-containing protein, partial [Candidatus Omnitrophota bacterium]